MLEFGFSSRTPLILQSEAAECGLACLAMVAGHHGHRIDLATLRARHNVSLRGSTLASLLQLAGELQLNPRPLRLEMEQLPALKLPCLIHWDLNHFVVLVRCRGERLTIHDPAVGQRELPLAEFSRHFTGVALELTPGEAFVPRKELRPVRLHALLGSLHGFGGRAAQILALALVLQFFSLLAPFYLQWVVDQVLVAYDRDLLTVLAIGFLLLALLQAAVIVLRHWLLIVLGMQLNLKMLSRLFQHLLRLPMRWFDNRHLGDIVSRFDSMNTIQRTLTAGFLEVLVDGLMALLTLAMMFVYSVSLAAIAIAAALAYALLRLALYRPQQRSSEEHIVRSARQHSHFLESVRGMQSIKLHVHEHLRGSAWQNLLVDQFNAHIRSEYLALLNRGLNVLLFGGENVLTIWLGARLVLDSTAGSGFSIGMLLAFIAYKTQFVQRIVNLIEKGLELRMLSLHSARVGDIVLTPVENVDALPLSTAPIKGQLQVHDLRFRHGSADPLLLDGVSFSVLPGESVAIVGPSGGGKTTLIKLLLGLLQPEGGQITIDGVPLSRLGMRHYREQVASVMQEDQLFAGSIADNITFFAVAPDQERLALCARLAAVDEDIAALPMAYHTLVGDMGTVLSGGQKQRILLARALYRQPRILFLDEATSHLDIARERLVNDAVRTLPLTRIIVAHRPETIASCDRVIVLNGGRVASEMRSEPVSEPRPAMAV